MKKPRLFFLYMFILSLLLQSCAANSTGPDSSAGETAETVSSAASDSVQAEAVPAASLSEKSGGNRILKTGDIPELDLTPPRGEPLEEPIGYTPGTVLGETPNVPSSPSLIKNEGNYFFYYDQLTSDEQQLYDTLYSVFSYPDDTSWSVTTTLPCDPGSEDFDQLWARAYTALIYDHAELFWYWHRQSCGYMHWSYSTAPDSEGRYRVTFNLNEPYTQYQTEMTAFNRATQNFLDRIDLSQSDACIAMQIHDELMDLCHYNDDLYENPENMSYGYSAYGALVDDGDGRDNCCVCAGYALAYEYLMQQVGIPCIYVRGDSGPDYSNMGSHAWNLVLLDGDWYEVDITWDDIDQVDKDFFRQWPAGEKMLNDADFVKKATHCFFCVTTDYISNFTDSDSYVYEDSDSGSWVSTCNDSVRTRCNSDQDPVVYLAPIANGTTYCQGRNCDK